MAKHLPKPITAREQKFVAEYMVDLNATQAALRVGYGKGNLASATIPHSQQATT
jgi:phage terminase small subunit